METCLKQGPESPIHEENITITPFFSGEGNLSYLILNANNYQGFLIDPDLEILGQYLLYLDKEGIQLVASLDTHTHAEHATAGPTLLKLLGSDFWMHQLAQGSSITKRFQHGDSVEIAGIPVEFIHTPGHTPEMTTIKIKNNLFTGDSLFISSCGRADFPVSNPRDQYFSLEHLKSFPNETVIYPGHDYQNRISSPLGEIKKNNPRLQFQSPEAFKTFMDTYYQNEEKPDEWPYFVGFNSR